MLNKPDGFMGVGINFRSEIADEIVNCKNLLDFIEIGTERFFVSDNNIHLNQLISEMPVVLHGLTLSIGTYKNEIDSIYQSNLTKVLKKLPCKWFSEHIAITHVDGIEIRSLMPVEFTDARIENIVGKVKKIQSFTNIPFLLENITYYYNMPNCEMNELYFINEIINKADCGLLLDINNLYVNAVNHNYDPYDFISKLPLERIVEVHLAGCNYMHGMLIDTHASSIKNEVISLFEYVCKKTSLNGVVIERDDKLDNFTELLDEVELIRKISQKYYSIKH